MTLRLLLTFTVALSIAFVARPARAEVHLQVGPADPAGPVPLELPLFDLPYNRRAPFDSPSMGQSLWITTDAYALMHVGLASLADPWGQHGGRVWGVLLAGAADVLTLGLPPFLAWQHEEWHRAVLANRSIDSFNDVYNFQIFAETIAVSHVTDEDLIRLKATHPADQVRLGTAGIEGNYELAYNLERQAFFDDSPVYDRILIPLLYLQNSAYLYTCSTEDVDRITDEGNAADGSDVARRDFTGADCTGWAYDLFRPDEPYQARGPHPSGVGIDRYRKRSHLTSDEQSYLRRQTWLSLLNALDPAVIGIRRFEITGEGAAPPLLVTFAVRHLPTSFGSVIRGDLFLRRERLAMIVSQQNYLNGQRYFPGLEASVLRYPLPLGATRPLALTARLGLWLQPAQQRYDDTDSAAGGLASARLGLAAHRRLEPYLEVEAKSAGWVAGNVFLDRNFSLRLGLAVRAF